MLRDALRVVLLGTLDEAATFLAAFRRYQFDARLHLLSPILTQLKRKQLWTHLPNPSVWFSIRSLLWEPSHPQWLRSPRAQFPVAQIYWKSLSPVQLSAFDVTRVPWLRQSTIVNASICLFPFNSSGVALDSVPVLIFLEWRTTVHLCVVINIRLNIAGTWID